LGATALAAAFLSSMTIVAADHSAGPEGVPAAPDAFTEPPPSCSAEATRPLATAIGPTLVPFNTSPFPYKGEIPSDNKPFLDYQNRGHTSPRGSLHLEKEAYYDKHSLLYLPPGFDLSRPALIVVFFHGNYARLHEDIQLRQRVPQQLAGSGLNAALVAPQFAVNIADSSAGWFWHPGVFNQYLGEAAEHLAELSGKPCARTIFDRLGVILVAYSGGYDPAAYALAVGGADARVRGVILLDALYGETDKFEKWIEEWVGARRSAFFFSAYSDSSRAENLILKQSLPPQYGIMINTSPHPLRLTQGSATFLFAGSGIDHKAFVTNAWVSDPLKAVLSAIEGFRISVRAALPPVGASPRQTRTGSPPQAKPRGGGAVQNPPPATAAPLSTPQ
jgi:hypothetical protein